MVSMRCSVLIYLASLRYRIQTDSCILHHSVGEVLTHPVFSLSLESSPRCVKRTSFIFFESCLLRGALERASAVTESFPAACSILNEYFVSLIGNL